MLIITKHISNIKVEDLKLTIEQSILAPIFNDVEVIDMEDKSNYSIDFKRNLELKELNVLKLIFFDFLIDVITIRI